jgi:hypothetical protein
MISKHKNIYLSVFFLAFIVEVGFGALPGYKKFH